MNHAFEIKSKNSLPTPRFLGLFHFSSKCFLVLYLSSCSWSYVFIVCTQAAILVTRQLWKVGGSMQEPVNEANTTKDNENTTYA